MAAVFVLPGCGGEKVEGVYRDQENPSVRYELRNGGAWSAEFSVEVPAGVFPHGAAKRIEGTFRRSGNLLELLCTAASRQDPVSGLFQPEEGDLAAYNHRLLFENGVLIPVGPKGEKQALFASDLNPLGARKLVREAKQQ